VREMACKTWVAREVAGLLHDMDLGLRLYIDVADAEKRYLSGDTLGYTGTD